MKALITGATGFIGSHLAERVAADGHDVRIFLRETSNRRWIDHLDAEITVGSFTDPVSLDEAVADVDVVYHVAGVVAARDRKGFYDGNVEATRSILDAIERVNPTLSRFLHSSSLAAVGPAVSPDRPVDESFPLNPITTYGESKAEAERLVESYADRIPVTIVRPPAVYGPRDVGIYTFFQVVAKGIAPLIGRDRKLVSLVHVRDLVDGIVRAATDDRGVGRTYFISSEGFYDWPTVGDVTARALGKKSPRYLKIPHPIIRLAAGGSEFFGRFQKKPPILDREKGRDIMQPYWLCSVDRAKEELGYRQQVSLEEGVAETAAWYSDQGWI